MGHKLDLFVFIFGTLERQKHSFNLTEAGCIIIVVNPFISINLILSLNI
mgnify:CR=1 FL=1